MTKRRIIIWLVALGTLCVILLFGGRFPSPSYSR